MRRLAPDSWEEVSRSFIAFYLIVEVSELSLGGEIFARYVKLVEVRAY